MYSRVFVALIFAVLAHHSAYSQVKLDTGLFLGQPGLEENGSDFGINFRGDLSGPGPNIGMSVRVGKLLLGLETMSDYYGRETSNISGVVSDNGQMTAGFTAVHGPTHRAMMGFRISKNTAIYGFHGLSGYSIQHELNYSSQESVTGKHAENQTVWVEKEVYRGCKRYVELVPEDVRVEYDVSAIHSSTGYSLSQFDGVRNSIGAGVEAFLLGGIMRLEYNMSHTSGFTQSADLSHATTDNRVANQNEQETYTYKWKGATEQSIQFRWKASF